MGRNRKSTRTIISSDVLPLVATVQESRSPWSSYGLDDIPIVTFENARELADQFKIRTVGSESKYISDRNDVRKVVVERPADLDAWLDALPAIPDKITSTDTAELLGMIQSHEARRLLATALYGNTEQRRKAIERIVAHEYANKNTPYEITHRSRHSVMVGITEINTVLHVLRNSSIEYMWYTSLTDADKKAGRLTTDDADYNEFMERFWKKWANEPMTGIGFAQMHHYLSRVGPNAEYSPTLDFYPYPDVPPGLNPKIVAALNEQYRRTQAALKRTFDSDEENRFRVESRQRRRSDPPLPPARWSENHPYPLERGTSMRPGLALESWTTDPETARDFSSGFFSRSQPGPDLRRALIPAKFIFGSYRTIPTWSEDMVRGKQEYMVLGTAFYRRNNDSRQGAGRRWFDEDLTGEE